MVFNIPESGLALESSARAMAGLPTQAFAITLSDSVIENMIQCVRGGQDIQLSLGSSPVSFLRAHTPSPPPIVLFTIARIGHRYNSTVASAGSCELTILLRPHNTSCLALQLLYIFFSIAFLFF